MAQIVQNACPAGWSKTQVQANLHRLNLAAQTRYYTGLKSVEPNNNTRLNAKKQGCEENNNLSIKNQSNESLSAISELNQIEEICNIHDDIQTNPANNVSTEVRIQSLGINVKHLMLGLLDTGATGVFIKQNVLKNIKHQVRKVNIKVKGRYASSHLKEVSLFDIKLPDFCNSCSISIRAYIEEDTVGHHDIVLGLHFIQQLGLIFDFKCCAVSWDKVSIPTGRVNYN